MISKSNHVKFARFVLLGVSEEAKKNYFNFFRSMYNKTIIRFGFCDIQNNRGLGKGYQPQPTASADNPYLDLDYSGYHKKPHPITVYYLLRPEITKSHLSNRVCQHCGVKTSTVTASFYYIFNISLSCSINVSSFIGNLWWVLLLGNHLKTQ